MSGDHSGKRPLVVTVCGSTRFKSETLAAIRRLEEAGCAVFSVGSFMHADGIEYCDEMKRRLDSLHKEKIRMSDSIYVVNPGGYIGESTASEIALAHSLGISVDYLVPPERDTREQVAWFAGRMEAKLAENDWKGGWSEMALPDLLSRLIGEVAELSEALEKSVASEVNALPIVREASDVANYAMMIADIARTRGGLE